jgi:hypothetical protein
VFISDESDEEEKALATSKSITCFCFALSRG